MHPQRSLTPHHCSSMHDLPRTLLTLSPRKDAPLQALHDGGVVTVINEPRSILLCIVNRPSFHQRRRGRGARRRGSGGARRLRLDRSIVLAAAFNVEGWVLNLPPPYQIIHLLVQDIPVGEAAVHALPAALLEEVGAYFVALPFRDGRCGRREIRVLWRRARGLAFGRCLGRLCVGAGGLVQGQNKGNGVAGWVP